MKAPAAMLLRILCLALLVTPLAGQDEEDALLAGEWTGSYQLSGSDPVDAAFVVESDEEGNEWTIVMMLDLEPQEDFTYSFEDIKVDGAAVSFRFGTGESAKICELRRDTSGQLSGTCKTEMEAEGSRPARLSMRPPSTP